MSDDTIEFTEMIADHREADESINFEEMPGSISLSRMNSAPFSSFSVAHARTPSDSPALGGPSAKTGSEHFPEVSATTRAPSATATPRTSGAEPRRFRSNLLRISSSSSDAERKSDGAVHATPIPLLASAKRGAVPLAQSTVDVEHCLPCRNSKNVELSQRPSTGEKIAKDCQHDIPRGASLPTADAPLRVPSRAKPHQIQGPLPRLSLSEAEFEISNGELQQALERARRETIEAKQFNEVQKRAIHTLHLAAQQRQIDGVGERKPQSSPPRLTHRFSAVETVSPRKSRVLFQTPSEAIDRGASSIRELGTRGNDRAHFKFQSISNAACSAVAAAVGVHWTKGHSHAQRQRLFFSNGVRLTEQQEEEFYCAAAAYASSDSGRRGIKPGSLSCRRRHWEDDIKPTTKPLDKRPPKSRTSVLRHVFDLLDIQHKGVLQKPDLAASLELIRFEAYPEGSNQGAGKRLSRGTGTEAATADPIDLSLFRQCAANAAWAHRHPGSNPYRAFGCTSQEQFRVLCAFAVDVVLPLLEDSEFEEVEFSLLSRIVLSECLTPQRHHRTARALWKPKIDAYFKLLGAP